MEREERRKIFIKKVGYSLLYFMMFTTATVLTGLRYGGGGIKPLWALNTGINLFAMPIGFLLGIFTLEDNRKKGGYQTYFRPMLSITSVGLLADIVTIHINENPAFVQLNIAVNTVFHLCSAAGCYVLWRFVTTLIPPDEEYERLLDRVMRCWAFVFAATVLLNVPLGFYFSIDGNGHFVRGKLFYLSVIYLLVTIAFSTILMVRNRKRMKTGQMLSLGTYMSGPLFIVLIMTRLNIELSIGFAVMMLNMLVIYCTFNIEEARSRILAEKDILMAANIQQSVLPRVFPPFPERKEFALHAGMYPAKTVGGDFYDFFLIDDDHLCMIIGDVSGKGVPASLFMMSSRSVIHGTARMGSAPEKILKISNEEIVSSNPEAMFVTVWLGILEISTGILRTSSAGHEYPAVRHAGGEFELLNDEHGIPVGLMAGAEYPSAEIRMESGDSIFVYTDGIPEATDMEGVQFGNDRMLKALNSDPDAPPEQLLDHMKSGVGDFVKEAEQFDDLTMLCLKYYGSKNAGCKDA